jgi:hypothetical protein
MARMHLQELTVIYGDNRTYDVYDIRKTSKASLADLQT